jgi:hypothetical protein
MSVKSVGISPVIRHESHGSCQSPEMPLESLRLDWVELGSLSQLTVTSMLFRAMFILIHGQSLTQSMPVRRLGAAQHLTCERAYSGYEIDS